MSDIKMYWWQEVPNFGDGLNPFLVESISGHSVTWSTLETADLVGAGSLLQWITTVEDKLNKPLNVWGSGYIFDKEPATSSKFIQYHAVRGYKSKQYGKLDDVVLGDPGLLSDILMPDQVLKQYAIGIVPHLWHLNDPILSALLERTPNMHLIDVRQDPLDVIKQIAECEFIFASSLHGLIVADSFGVPNQWVHFSRPLFGGDWKFQDYYSLYDIETAGVQLMAASPIESLVNDAKVSYQRPGLANIKRALLDAFPRI